jgi:6-phosphogluconate dehydrogenase
MELGIIGLGKMGSNMAERLRLAGHNVVGFDFSKEATAKLTANGSRGVNSLEELVSSLSAPRAI